MDFAPVIAKYNPASTSAFETIINIINRCGFDALNIHFKMGFLLNLASVPNSEINKQPTTMGILKDAIRKVLTEEAQRTGRDIRFLDTPARVIETPAQAKYNDIRRVERGYVQGVHKARRLAMATSKSLCASCRHGSRYGSSYFCSYRCWTQQNNKYKCERYLKSEKNNG